MYINSSVLNGALPVNKEQLHYLVENYFDYNLSELDTLKITHLSDIEGLFRCISRQNLSGWDVSNVVDISKVDKKNKNYSDYIHPYEYFKVFQDTYLSMLVGRVPVDETLFRHLAENHNKYDLTNLDTSKITNMCNLFDHEFNQDIRNWDVSNVNTMSSIFRISYNRKVTRDDMPTLFGRPLDRPPLEKIPASFDHDISHWNVTSVTDICNFKSEKFLKGIHPYEYFKVFNYFISDKVLEGKLPVNGIQLRYLIHLHYDGTYDLSNLDTSQIEDMGRLFESNDGIYQEYCKWDVSNVKNLPSIFDGSSYFGINPFVYFNQYFSWAPV